MACERVKCRLPRLMVAATALCLSASVVVASPKDAALPASKGVASEPTTLKLDVTGGRWAFSSRGATFRDVAKAIESKAPVDIRIQDPALESIPMGMAFDAPDTQQAMRQVLGNFNYSEFVDPKSGRRVYLVTSMASETRRPAPEARSTAVASAASPPAAAESARTSRAESIDDFRKVAPARILSREQPQEEIDREVQRERDQKLLRAVDALANSNTPSTVQRDALADLARSGDPRATPALSAAWSQVAGLPGDAAPQVARSVWQHAAQLQFADAEANALLLSLGTSANARVREVAQAARRDMERYRAAQDVPPGR